MNFRWVERSCLVSYGNTIFCLRMKVLFKQRHFLKLRKKWYVKVKVKCSRYRPGVAQRVGRGIALLFHDRGTRRGWVVSSTPRPHFTSGKDPVPILQEAGWAPGPVWTGGKSRPQRHSIRDRPARSQSLYRLSYPTHQGYEKSVETGRCGGGVVVMRQHYTLYPVNTFLSNQEPTAFQDSIGLKF